MSKLFPLLLVTALIGAISASGFDTMGHFSACAKDRDKLCRNVHGLAKVMSCLSDHDQDLSEKCKHAIETRPLFKCAHDAMKFCPDIKTHHELLMCIWQHKQEVSDQCKKSLMPPTMPFFLGDYDTEDPKTPHQYKITTPDMRRHNTISDGVASKTTRNQGHHEVSNNYAMILSFNLGVAMTLLVLAAATVTYSRCRANKEFDDMDSIIYQRI
uniref:Uncharacterized protein n=1 Tax=Spongospora subterranea TaxID=70186 RepID=A0A0H5QLT1_9EUKA|eukprot:CRZ02301.1 hypothetical protein [Spongospora subterranea]